MNIQQIRKRYPQYNDLSDQELADRLYESSYSDMNREEFNTKIGFSAPSAFDSKQRMEEIKKDPLKALRDMDDQYALPDLRKGLTPEQLGSQRSFSEGATLGWGDEAAHALAAGAARLSSDEPYSDIYRKMRDRYQREQSAYREENPLLSLGLEMTGGVGTGGGLIKAFKDPSKTARFVKTIAGSTGLGGTTAAGFSEDDKKFENAVIGALTGGGIAGAIPIAGVGWNKIADAWRRYIPKHGKEHATRILRGALEKSGIKNADEVLTKLDEMGPAATLADIDDSLRLQAERAANRPGEAFRRSQYYATRGKESGRRIAQDIDDLFGGRVKLGDFIDDVVARSKEEAGPIYREAMRQRITITPELTDILNTPAAKTALRKAQTIARNDGVVLSDITDMQTLDYLKKGLDEVIDRSGRTVMGKTTPIGRSVNNLKRRLLDELDAQNPVYKQARRVYAGLAETKKAAEEGAKFWNKTDQQIKRSLREMSQSERDAFRYGAMQKLYDEAKKTTDAGSAYKRLFGDAAKRDKIKAIFQDEDAFRSFESALKREEAFIDTLQRTRHGSQTARRIAPDEMISTLPTSKAQLIFDAGNRMLRKMPIQSEEASNQLARLLMSPGEEARRAARYIFTNPGVDPRRAALAELLQGGAPVIGGRIAGGL